MALALNLYLPALAPNLHLPALAPNLYLMALPQICIYRPWLQIFIYRSWSVWSLGLGIPTLSPQFVFTGPGLQFVLPCSEFVFTFLFVVVAVVAVIAVISLDYNPRQGMSDKL